MGTSLTRLKVLLGGLSLIALAVVALGVARADSQVEGRQGATNSEGNLVGRETASSVDGRLTDALSVLRSPRTESDVMPVAAADFVRRTGIAGMNPDLSQRAASDGDYALFVVPANDAVCLHAVSGDAPASAGGTCGEVAEAANGSIVMAGTTESGVRISGLLPDGVEHATIVLSNGDSVETDVAENVYTAVVDTSVEAISFSVGGTQTTVPTPFPVPGS